ncbi:MAG: AraC family transcriptional regulator [Pseudomonadota bacterium]
MTADIQGSAIQDGRPMLICHDLNELARKTQTNELVNQADNEVNAVRFTIGSHQSELRDLDDFTLILSLASEGDLDADIGAGAESVRVRPGILTFAPPVDRQCYDFRGSTTNTILSIKRSVLERVAEMDPALPQLSALEPRSGWTRPTLQRLIENQFQVMMTADVGWRVLAEANALRIAYELLVALGGEEREPGAPLPLTPAELDRLMEFIDGELENDFDLSDMAGVFDRDPFGFSRSFKAATGESPHQFVIQRRLMRVKALLEKTDETLAQIAYAAGFSSQSHMTATFSKHFAMPPGAYRKQWRT